MKIVNFNVTNLSVNYMKIIVGLGNPGEKYKSTRHNIGFMVVDALAKKLNLNWEKNKNLKAETVKFDDVLLVKPQTFMNLSGESVKAVLSYYKSPSTSWGEVPIAHDLVVVHDDLDIDFEKYKISTDSRAAGHNGVQSIIDQLGTKNFTRYRIGIRNPRKEKVPTEKFVLEKFKPEELKIIKELLDIVAEELIK